MLLVFRSPVAGGLRVCLAHIGPLLRVAVVAPSREVVNVRLRVDPNNGIRWTAGARLRVGCELSSSGSAYLRPRGTGAGVGAGAGASVRARRLWQAARPPAALPLYRRDM